MSYRLAKLIAEIREENPDLHHFELNFSSSHQQVFAITEKELLKPQIAANTFAYYFAERNHVSMLMDCISIPQNINRNWILDLPLNGSCTYVLNKYLGKLFHVNYKEFIVIAKIQPLSLLCCSFVLRWSFSFDSPDEEWPSVKVPSGIVWPFCQRFGRCYTSLFPSTLLEIKDLQHCLTDFLFVEIENQHLLEDFYLSISFKEESDKDWIPYQRTWMFNIQQAQRLCKTKHSSLYAFSLNALQNDKTTVGHYLEECLDFLEICTNGNLDKLPARERYVVNFKKECNIHCIVYLFRIYEFVFDGR